jgi:hypothetical protein
VLQVLIKQWDEHLVVRHGFVGGLQTEDLVDFGVDHRMDFDPAAPDLPLLLHPFAPVGDLDPGTVDDDDDTLGKELRNNFERKI